MAPAGRQDYWDGREYNGSTTLNGYDAPHMPSAAVSVKIGARVLPRFDATATDRAVRDKARADFAAASEGWYFDGVDRRGVLHVKVAPQRLAEGFVVTVAR